MERVYNFNAGPAALPLEVLQQLQEEMINYKGYGLSVLEMSHRSKEYLEILHNTTTTLRELMHISDDYEVLFIQGGASLQFAMVPMNFLSKGKIGNYVLTGVWAKKALAEAKKIGATSVLATSETTNFNYIPEIENEPIHPKSAYVHITSNNTIHGTQWQTYPTLGVPLFADMSSDILSREINVNNFDLIYAGAQKNLGPAGVAVVIVKKALLEQIPVGLPTMLDYRTYANNDSLYNTPPSYSIYVLGKVLQWVKKQGGVTAIEKQNNEKAALLYDVIDSSNGFYLPHANKNSRSKMNITFNLASKELESLFLQKAKDNKFIGLNGHRSVGGCRISTYNAVSLQTCSTLAQFMIDFQKQNNCR
ncbi:MAG: 3-phosphoserine/phosphohydroxythreonine transaminase [Bacillaceae bacterium]